MFQLRPIDEPASPLTPPPNYDAALMILAQSSESLLSKAHRCSCSLLRRSLSLDQVQGSPSSPGIRDISEENAETHNCSKHGQTKSRSIFRFSGTFRKHSASNSSGAKNYSDSTQCQTSLLTPPPYPFTPTYPNTPPPPFTPTVPEIHIQPAMDLDTTQGQETIS